MEAIVLAGGRGTRLKHIITDLPKPMAPVGTRPFLEIVLTRLAHDGFQRIVLSVGYLAEKIVAHFGRDFRGITLDYVFEDIPLGTGGAARLALTRCREDHVFVFNGDTYLDLEVDRVEARWQEHHKPIIVAREVADTERYGRLEVHEGCVHGFLEKRVSGPGLINAGCYVLRPTALDMFPLGQTFSLETDFLMKTITPGEFDCFVTRGYFIDIGAPEDYLRAQTEIPAIC